MLVLGERGKPEHPKKIPPRTEKRTEIAQPTHDAKSENGDY